ncbi:MAG: leucine-rich repeat domain-containing protein [Lachnospiraceae bacterium]|nr:leucine-rich repeat domain-containing protein [Lachnospiraceae bacterium]
MILQVLKRTAAIIIATSLIFTTLPPVWQSVQNVQAAESNRSMAMGVSAIQSPSRNGASWNGDYIYYGNYQGNTIKWRVLDVTGNSGNSSMPGGMLLQANQALSIQKPFEDGSDQENEHQQGTISDNQWLASDIRPWLQGEDASQFINYNNFSAKEKAGIMQTNKEAGISLSDNIKSTGLNQDSMFLLDISDLSNANYGYQIVNGLTDSSIGNFWWLRSTHANTKYDNVVGSVLPGGYIYYNFTSENGDIVPAFNLDTSKILFVSDANIAKNNSLQPITSASVHEWKVTLLDNDKNVSVSGTPGRNGNVIHIPYTYSGDAGDQLSLMITGSDGTIRHYGKVADTALETGSIDFTLPNDFNENDDTVSIFAEQVNATKQTDYASPLAEVEIPPLHQHTFPDTWQYNKTEHWRICNAPGCDGINNQQRGEHYFEEDDERSEAATCIADGILWYSCACGYAYSEPDLRSDHIDEEDGTMDSDLHDFDENEPELIKKPTYTTAGSQRIFCVLCNQWITEIIDPLSEEHEFEEEIIKEATCTEDGSKRLTCSEEYCEEVRIETIPAPGHSFEAWIQTKDPTTTENGVSMRACSVCGVTETKSIPKIIPTHTHNYHKDVWMTNDSSHWHQCDCGNTENMNDHEWSSKIIAKATKKSTGMIKYTCEVCDYNVYCQTAAIGTEFSVGNYRYKVIKGKKNQLAVTTLGFVKGKVSKTVRIPETVVWHGARYTTKAIAKGAFRNRKKIRKIVINNSIETIGNLAFFGDKNVKKITIGKKVKGVGAHAFCHMKHLNKIVVKSKKMKRSTENGIFHNTKSSKIIVPKSKLKKYKKTIFAANANNVSSK